MAFAPEVFACGISMYGLGDLEAAFKHPFTSGPYWRQRIGNPDVPEELALIRRHSPINYIKQIKNPLLISHGSLDERVPQSQSDNMAKALKAAGKDVIYYYYPEEGHDYAQPENWQSFWAIGERFLQEHLGGRCEPAGVDLKQPNFKMVEWATKLPIGIGRGGVKTATKTQLDIKHIPKKTAPRKTGKTASLAGCRTHAGFGPARGKTAGLRYV